MSLSTRAIVVKDNQLLVMKRNKFGKRYYSLIGGKVEAGEELEAALKREIHEETQIEIANPRLVVIQEAFKDLNKQYIYLCDYVSGEPKLDPKSIETKLNKYGMNKYQPCWVDTKLLKDLNLLPPELKDLILQFLDSGFPEKPVDLLLTKS